ncbi:DUF3658 domain-containing protein [Bacillus carboniphilus]|uniref:DUF3658 domain-containing protein n=1 Tax=Bacillus carboniphilus TaxID=86663 RepID=A0ABY9JUM4_9BACI|nr:DUF3658 domain-containing protein [Bacillus carboniphilus]WLR42494.1 DUF3658 domain-containing protein [Bacillus carboniphilus]
MDYEKDYMYQYLYKWDNLVETLSRISESSQVVIWVSDNANEQTGIRYVLYLLKNKDCPIFVLNMNELYKQHFKGERNMITSGQIKREELEVLYREIENNEPLSSHERKDLEKQWGELSEKQKVLRIWRSNQIIDVDENYFDMIIIKKAQDLYIEHGIIGFMHASRLIGVVIEEIIDKHKQYIDFNYLNYRLRELISKEVFERKDALNSLMDCRINYLVKLAKCYFQKGED